MISYCDKSVTFHWFQHRIIFQDGHMNAVKKKSKHYQKEKLFYGK